MLYSRKRRKRRRKRNAADQKWSGIFSWADSDFLGRAAGLQWLLIAIWAAVTGLLTRSALLLGLHQELERPTCTRPSRTSGGLGAPLAGLCCVGIAAIHGMTILLETTAGNDRMENWPNVGLSLDWAGELWYIFNTAVVSILLGLGLDWFCVNPPTIRDIPVMIVVFVTFPILLLCTLESGSPFVPISARVFVSLGRHTVAWLTFYLQSGSLLAAAGG